MEIKKKMELWLDTTDEQMIRDASEMGILTGVTTNPSILSKAGKSPDVVLEKLLDIQTGYVAAQVTADDLPGMLKQAERLDKLDSNHRVIIKIPASGNGFKAMALLKKQGIKTLATTVLETKQLILSALAGASYIAPYFNRIENLRGASGHALSVLKEMQEIINVQRYPIKIMAAAIHSTQQYCDCARVGVGAITVPVPVYQDLMQTSSHVAECLNKFKEDWNANQKTEESALFCS